MFSIKKNLVLTLFLVFAGALFFSACAEDITITTYYPSPFGSYQQLEVRDFMRVGTASPLISQTSLVSGGYVRAPRFEDADNTAYYVDPSGNALIQGSVGIRTTTPNSALQVASGYLQIHSVAGAPPAVDCNLDTMRGRMVLDRTNNRLYVCNGAARGWDYETLTN